MKSRKKLICLAVAASLVMGAAFTGCTATDNEADVKQTVATVNISKTDAFKKEFAGYESAVTEKVFVKRDMITAYYNGYYQNVQTGSTNAEVFESIKDDLVANAVTTQYAVVYMLKAKGDGALTEYLAQPTEIAKYEYILGEEKAAKAKYTLNVTLNSVLDSAEKEFLKDEKDDDYSGSGTRSTPTGIDSTVEEYFPENYNVYTGYDGYLLPDDYDRDKPVKEGDYEPLYGTTKVTRRKAYAAFLARLDSNYLLTEEDTKTTDIWKISYVLDSYVSQLQSEIISEFQDKIKEEQEEEIKTVENGIYTYVKDQYDSLLDVQKSDYNRASSFESAMGSMSDTKFILYSPSTESDTENQGGTYGTFGYVYNILLPFSAKQNAQLKVAQSRRDSDIIDESGYFKERNEILKNIQTTDQRSAWFNGSTDYSFKASETELEYYGKDKGREYLFFENNVTDTENKQYEALEKYYGRYSYNGTVRKNTNGSYTLIPEKLTIDDMLDEFVAYLNYVLGGDLTYTTKTDYYDETDFTKGKDGKEIDYEKLVYAWGKIDFDDKREDMFVKDSARYKAMSAVNELQYAYTTDTGVLSQYIGYTVSAYDTSYIKEFEYAAQAAVREGVGSFKVCAGDYGWHLIYVTETFDTAGVAVYAPDFTVDRVTAEGTFENRFYNWVKDSQLAKEVTLKNNTILKEYKTDKAVKVNADAYKDLSE